MARLLSLNVGLPRDITWNGKTVRTAIWKFPVEERRMVRKLNIALTEARRKNRGTIMATRSVITKSNRTISRT
jgi:hypothetical protein